MTLFKKATRQKSKLRLALTGVAGAGKTLGALLIAFGMTGDWSKVALIDTEHDRARFYANRADLGIGEFMHASMPPPYSSKRYKDYIAEGTELVGEDGVVIIDSFSHAWNNEGGILDLKEEISKRQGKNGYTAWNEAGKEQTSLVNSILSVNCHTIATMRSKMEYAMQVNDRGKQEPVKIGLAPIQRDDTEYEFDIVLDIARNHFAVASKDTTFLDRFNNVITIELGAQLKKWLDEGLEPPKCERCAGIIVAKRGKTVEQIVNGTKKCAEQQLCLECLDVFLKEQKAAKANEASNEGANENFNSNN